MYRVESGVIKLAVRSRFLLQSTSSQSMSAARHWARPSLGDLYDSRSIAHLAKARKAKAWLAKINVKPL
jgi:hypothetical protein